MLVTVGAFAGVAGVEAVGTGVVVAAAAGPVNDTVPDL
jgi:hypothetical protein